MQCKFLEFYFYITSFFLFRRSLVESVLESMAEKNSDNSTSEKESQQQKRRESSPANISSPVVMSSCSLVMTSANASSPARSPPQIVSDASGRQAKSGSDDSSMC